MTIIINADGTIEDFDNVVKAICENPDALQRFAGLYEPIEELTEEEMTREELDIAA